MDDLISRQAAIDELDKGAWGVEWDKTLAKTMIESLPSAQQERIIYGNMSDEEFEKWLYGHGICSPNIRESIPCDAVPLLIDNAISELPSARPEQRWIPFKTRPLTKEEKEEHPEWDGIIDCKLPDDGQRILVNVSVRGHESVQYDEFYTDDGSYLDSGYEIGTEATAWMPLPEPYKTESEDKE